MQPSTSMAGQQGGLHRQRLMCMEVRERGMGGEREERREEREGREGERNREGEKREERGQGGGGGREER